MALMKLRGTDPAAIDVYEPPLVPALADNHQYVEAVALENALKARLDRCQLEIERLAHEAYFASRPSGVSDGPRDTVQRARWEKLRALPPYWSTESTDPAPLGTSPPALRAAIALLRGEPVSLELNHAERRARLERERQVLDEGVRFQAGVIEQLRADLSLQVCKGLKHHHDALLSAFFRALQASAALADKERAFRSALLIAGYEIQPDLLPAPFISAPLMLGSEQRYDSQISNYRRFLQQRGIVS